MAENQIVEIVVGILAGTAGAFTLGALSAAITIRRRVGLFARIKHERSSTPPAWLMTFSPAERSAHKQRDKAMRQLLASVHAEAKAFQDRTLAQLVAASAVLFGALVVTALGVTLWRDSNFIHFASSSFDLAALIVSFSAFRRSGRYRTAWLRRRAVAEFLRQWLTVDYLLTSPGPALTHRVECLLAEWESAITQDPQTLLASTGVLARKRIADLGLAVAEADPSDDDLRSYWSVRPHRQARWFEDSLERLERSHHNRGRFMACTFVVAAIAGCVKLVALTAHNDVVANAALFIFLICVGLAGASSSAYLGQNQRSLKHRYSQQLRAIEHWQDSSKQDGLAARLSGNASVRISEIVRDICAFERLMMVELLDWMAITTDDAMELAAS
ncbi:hypothetical protein [Nitrospirillum iridis]|uniref:SMODS and SLOG-associating 2TM effector domain-containing protein n=1 Tax=Nitrospirillum iridis TaxID=765888 RepID=A0A7X0B3T1_9PROT|nr:hypothetical protein [Nitrospirillum iridis]MBB6255213.1 hypothetical protein [Nitrospirillum iridis]